MCSLTENSEFRSITVVIFKIVYHLGLTESKLFMTGLLLLNFFLNANSMNKACTFYVCLWFVRFIKPYVCQINSVRIGNWNCIVKLFIPFVLHLIAVATELCVKFPI